MDGGLTPFVDVTGAVEHQVHLRVRITHEQENHPAYPGPSQEEIGHGGELEPLAGFAPDETVGAVADGMLDVRRGLQAIARNGIEQVRGERLHVPDRVVHLLAVHLGEPHHDRPGAFGRDRGDPPQQQGLLRVGRRIAGPVEREDHVARGDGRAVMPARAGVELEGEGQGIAPGPAPRQLWYESPVARRDEVGAHPRQAEKQDVGDIGVGLPVADLGYGRGGFGADDDDGGARDSRL